MHITQNKKAHYRIDAAIDGDSVAKSLQYVQYDLDEMVRKVRENLERSVGFREVTEQARRFLSLLERTVQSYTCLGE